MTVGVYKITNAITEDFYIGSSIEAEQRWSNHKSSAKKYKDRLWGISHLYRAMQKYGLDSFKFEIIEQCEFDVLREREQHYIDTLRPSYNCSLVATGGGGSWTSERKHKYSQRRKKEVAAGIRVPPVGNAGNKDFRHSEESIQLMKESVAKARERIIQERGSYHTPKGLEAMRKKRKAALTPERRQQLSEDTKEARIVAEQARKQKADVFAQKYVQIIEKMLKQGMTKLDIATRLNEDGHRSRRGDPWTDQTIRQVLKRTNKSLLSLNDRLDSAEKTRKKNSDDFAKKFYSIIKEMQINGLNMSEIAIRLNETGHKSRRNCDWTYASVREVLKRMGNRQKVIEIKKPLSSEVLGDVLIQGTVDEKTPKRMLGWDRKFKV